MVSRLLQGSTLMCCPADWHLPSITNSRWLSYRKDLRHKIWQIVCERLIKRVGLALETPTTKHRDLLRIDVEPTCLATHFTSLNAGSLCTDSFFITSWRSIRGPKSLGGSAMLHFSLCLSCWTSCRRYLGRCAQVSDDKVDAGTLRAWAARSSARQHSWGRCLAGA